MKKRSILITGGSGKFGQVFVRHFLEAGDNVIATVRTRESFEAMRSEFSIFSNLDLFQSDLSEEGAVSTLCEALLKNKIRPDCLINNARSQNYLRVEKDGRVKRHNFIGELLLDVVVPYELTMELALKKGSKLKHVVNIGSQYGTVAYNHGLYEDPAMEAPPHYGVAKAALAHLTKELAVRLAPSGISVNCIAYGGVEGRADREFMQRYAKLSPQGRMLREDEIAGPVDKVLSDAFSAMTGHVLAIDGGWSIW